MYSAKKGVVVRVEGFPKLFLNRYVLIVEVESTMLATSTCVTEKKHMSSHYVSGGGGGGDLFGDNCLFGDTWGKGGHALSLIASKCHDCFFPPL